MHIAHKHLVRLKRLRKVGLLGEAKAPTSFKSSPSCGPAQWHRKQNSNYLLNAIIDFSIRDSLGPPSIAPKGPPGPPCRLDLDNADLRFLELQPVQDRISMDPKKAQLAEQSTSSNCSHAEIPNARGVHFSMCSSESRPKRAVSSQTWPNSDLLGSEKKHKKYMDGMGTILPQKRGARELEQAGTKREIEHAGKGEDLNLIGTLSLNKRGSSNHRGHEQNSNIHDTGAPGYGVARSLSRLPSPKKRKRANEILVCNGNCPKTGWTIEQYCYNKPEGP